ncbi:MAG: hypothetical protein AAGA20_05120 [Planctomycetota bacterium]
MIRAHRTALVALVGLAALAPHLVAAQGAEEASWSLAVVDREGRAVPDLALAFVDTAPGGQMAGPSIGDARRADASGLIRGEGEPPFVLDVVSRDPAWAVAFVHAAQVEVETDGTDLLGRPLLTLDLTRPAVCVVERTGTIQVSIYGAGPDERFHATFVDERPEPAVHRLARATASFQGPTGTLAAPPGRGTLYIARDGAFGAPVVANGRPLIVPVVSGATVEVAVRLVDGPETMLMAPFDSIPFGRLDALSPDGVAVVASLPFDASPLRVPSAYPVALGTPFDPEAPLASRLPKHLVRAAEPRTSMSFRGMGPVPPSEVRPEVDAAPGALVFSVDVGGKMRLPEVEMEWVLLAQNGLRALIGETMAGGVELTLRAAAGTARLRPEEEGVATWTARVVTRDGEGAPLPMREVLVAQAGALPIRAVTDAEGVLAIEGLTADSVVAASFALPTDRVRIERGTNEAAALTLTSAAVDVSGTWIEKEGTPLVGGVMALVPADPNEAAALRPLGTRAYPIAITDATGAFQFRGVAPGDYVLRTDRRSEHALAVDADGAASLRLVGTGQKDPVSLEANE